MSESGITHSKSVNVSSVLSRALELALRRCAVANQWGREQAEEWWRKLAAMEVMKTVVVPKPASTENAFVAAAVPA
jgi:hypothetical protein